MNGIDFMDGLNEVDLEYIRDAEEDSGRAHIHWQHIVSLAACLAVMVTSGILLAAGVGGTPNVSGPSDGVASLIGSASGMFWLFQIMAAVGIVITIILMVRSNKKDRENMHGEKQ